MTDPYEDDVWPAPWILRTRHVPATPDAVEGENGSTVTHATPDAATGVSRAQRDAELWAYDELSREAAALRAEVARLRKVNGSVLATARGISRRADAAESALRQVRELADVIKRDGWVDSDYTAEALRAVLAQVGAADTQDEGAGGFERMLADPNEQFDKDGEVARLVIDRTRSLQGGTALGQLSAEAWQAGECGYPIEEPVQTTTASAVPPKPSTWIADLCGLPRRHAGDHVKRSDLPTAGSKVDAAPEADPWLCRHGKRFDEHYCDDHRDRRWAQIGAEQAAARDAAPESGEGR